MCILLTSQWNSESPEVAKEVNQAQYLRFCPQLTVQGAVIPPRPPVVYNSSVSVSPGNARIEPTTLQLIDETCMHMQIL